MVYNTQLQSKFAHTAGDPVPEFNSETPLHPALVHFPIAFNTLAWALDIFYGVTAIWIKPGFLTRRFGDDASLLDMSRLGYFLLCAGLLATIPAILSGNVQLLGMIKKSGLWEKDAEGKPKNTMVPKIKLAITHALANDLVFLLGVYSWYTRRSTIDRPNIGNIPSKTNIGISATLLPLLMASAKAGGTLVYNHGVGLKLGRKKYD